MINLASAVDKLFSVLQTVKYNIKEENLQLPNHQLSQNISTCDDIKAEIIKIKTLNENTGNLSQTLKNTTSTLSSAVDRLTGYKGPLSGIFVSSSEIVQASANLTSNQANQFKESLNFNENLIKELNSKATAMGCQ